MFQIKITEFSQIQISLNALIFITMRCFEMSNKILLIRKGKVVPALNQAPRHEDVWKSGRRASVILKFGTGWRFVVSFTTRPALPLGDIAFGIHWIGVCVGHRAGLDVVPGIEPWSFSPLFIHYTD
jgi:hypothetical protein